MFISVEYIDIPTCIHPWDDFPEIHTCIDSWVSEIYFTSSVDLKLFANNQGRWYESKLTYRAAWDKVTRFIKYIGPYTQVQYDDRFLFIPYTSPTSGEIWGYPYSHVGIPLRYVYYVPVDR